MFPADAAQVIAIVELENGVHLTTTLDVEDPASVSIGMAVRGTFDDRAPDGPVLLRFVPVG